jgi:hypothetical protein
MSLCKTVYLIYYLYMNFIFCNILHKDRRGTVKRVHESLENTLLMKIELMEVMLK